MSTYNAIENNNKTNYHIKRAKGESFYIGPVKVKFHGYDRGKAELSIEAPEHVSILRKDFLKQQEEKQ